MKLFFDIFGLKIPSYGFFAAVGILAVLVYLKRQKAYPGLDFDDALTGLLYALIGGGIGAKLLYWLTDPSSFTVLFQKGIPFLERVHIAFSGGMVFLGGLIGAILAVAIFLRIHKLDPLRAFDVLGVCMPILQMFGRMGCFFAGCCYGQPTNSCIGVVFPAGSLAPAGEKLIPTQLFGVFGNLLLAGYLIWYTQKRRARGAVIARYLILYAIGRAVIECFRGDAIRGIYYGLSTSQWLSIPIFFLGVGIAVYSHRLQHPKEPGGR